MDSAKSGQPSRGLSQSVLDQIKKINDFPYRWENRFEEFIRDYYSLFVLIGRNRVLVCYVYKKFATIPALPRGWSRYDDARWLLLEADDRPTGAGRKKRTESVNEYVQTVAKHAGTENKELVEEGNKLPVFTADGTHVFNMHPAGSQMLGVLALGVTLILRVKCSDGSMGYWVRKRSTGKKVHPSKLDMVGGDILPGEKPRDAVTRIASKKANISREHLQDLEPPGVVSYHATWGHSGRPGSHPHCIWVYGSHLPDGLEPSGKDEFVFMSESDVWDELDRGTFSPVSVHRVIDYFARSEVVKVEDKDLGRLHRPEIETPSLLHWGGTEAT